MTGTALASPSSNPSCGDLCPVDQISWNDVQQFLTRLNQQDPGKGYRLPTEAEWEYAARAGTTGDFGGNGVLDDMGWWQGNSNGRIQQVGQKLANAWALYDMHGNGVEFVNDWYSNTYYSISPSIDPLGPVGGTYKVLRGGAWYYTSYGIRSYDRITSATPDFRGTNYAFRLVRNP